MKMRNASDIPVGYTTGYLSKYSRFNHGTTTETIYNSVRRLQYLGYCLKASLSQK